MEKQIQGRVFKFGDNINTDIISPPQYIELTVEAASAHAMEAIAPNFAQELKPGDIIVAGSNFGSGSSRETSPLALKYLGVGAIIAKFFSRIFYRNAINIGLPIFECEMTDEIGADDIIRVIPEKGVIYDLNTGKSYNCSKIPEHIMSLIRDGGLVGRLEKQFNCVDK